METSEVFFLIVVLLAFAWLGAITFLTVRIFRTFDRLTQGVSEKDLKTILAELLVALKKNEDAGENLKEKIEELRLKGEEGVQKIGLVRFNPFSDTGGNQSFVLALLDGKNNGVVITSLHSRETTRVFAKPVVAGKESSFEFSKEETQAIAEAQKLPRSK